MKSLSIKIKVPLIFTVIIFLTSIISIIIISFFSAKRIENANAHLLVKFAAESSYEILVKDNDTLSAKIRSWIRNEKFVRSIYFADHNFIVVAHADKDFIGNKIPEEIIRGINSYNSRTSTYYFVPYGNKEQLFCMPIYVGNINLGYLLARIKRPTTRDVLTTTQADIKISFLSLFMFGGLILVVTAYYLSKQIVDPILEISEYVNKNTHASPNLIRPIPLRRKVKCWNVKKCENVNCENYDNLTYNCWEKYFNVKNLEKINPMSFPCFECDVFLHAENDEIERLKMFLNQLISSIKYHYQKNKQYSLKLEEMIEDRTKELKARSNELQAETLKSKLIIENVVEGTLVTDFEGRVIEINNNAKKLLNIKSGKKVALQNIPIGELVENKNLSEPLMSVIFKTVKNKVNIIEQVSLQVDGLDQYLLIKATLVQDKKNNFDMVICLIEDVTDQQILDRFKNEFFHTISHDLKNPLTSIIGFLDLVLHGQGSEDLGEKHRKLLNIAFHSGEELQRLIMDLSNLVKLQTGKIKLNIMQFPIGDLFYDIEDMFYPKLKEQQITMIRKIDPPELIVTADYYRLKQVYTNLLSNSIKVGQNIQITLGGYETPDAYILFIEDNGTGIPADKLPYIFEKFTRLYTYKDKSDGLGLGLSIVKTLINLHNGTITVESEYNKGTKFTITLPKE
ncbi:MAG: hypothetical protein A2Y40_05680 [Candidatus Margulisbacteria bacterium GWF2_35_9]|nr:MAG: hypothetical protein A2Y40_05680 [Candidatus Margulisbacteria bacterium GWF2_35_9]